MSNRGDGVKKSFSRIYENQWFFVLMVIIIVGIVTQSLNPRFMRVNNIVNILEQISVLGILSAGATILIISGNFDISVGSNLGLSACIMAMLMRADIPPYQAVIVGILVSILASLFVGYTSILFKAPSFITSLAATGVFKGIALALTEARFQTIYGQFEALGGTRFFGVVPLLFVISLSVFISVFVLLKYTLVGRRIFAIGSNPHAAYLVGIKVNANKLLFFGISGVLVGLAAALYLSRIGSAQASTGSGMELRAIGAAVIGGAVMSGGKGSVLGTFLGTLLMGVIANSLNMLQVSPYLQDVSFGIVLLIALGVSAFSLPSGKKGSQ